MAALLPPVFEWKRTSYNQKEVAEGVRLVFRDFESEYLRPAYLLDAFWDIVERQPKGYVHLVGPAGIGKTYVVRGLEREGPERDAPVLAYHILPGTLTDYRTFISELADRAREALGFRTQEAQSKVATRIELQEQFVEFLREFMRANRLDTLIVALDALDELPDPAPNAAAITDFLPSADQLPDGCFVLLTSREALRPQIRARVERLQQRGTHPTVTTARTTPALQGFTRLEVPPTALANQDLLRSYLHARLPEAFRTPEHVEAVLARCGGVFLYAFHFCSALAAGVFPDVAALPEGDQFYPAYLTRLRQRVGDVLFDTVYLPTLLFLAAAQQPVTLAQLSRWGLPHDRLHFAFLDLRDFLRVHRVRRWHESLADEDNEHRYEIAHEAFVRFIRDDTHLSAHWREAHAVIARLAHATHAGRWHEVDPDDDADLYDLRFVFPHLREAELTDIEIAIRRDEGYASACWAIGQTAYEKARYYLAADLFDRALAVYRYLITIEGRRELAYDLAAALGNKGTAPNSLGQLAEALTCYDEAIAICRQLVETEERRELANELAMALMNKGNALSDLGQLAEALTCYDEAIAIRRQLVETEERRELANELAMVLMNKGIAQEQLEQWQDAVDSFNEGIGWRERLVKSGMEHLTPSLIKGLRIRFDLYWQLAMWEAAAADVVKALTYAAPFLQSGSSPTPLAEEFTRFRARLHDLTNDERAQLYAALGEQAALVQEGMSLLPD